MFGVWLPSRYILDTLPEDTVLEDVVGMAAFTVTLCVAKPPALEQVTI